MEREMANRMIQKLLVANRGEIARRIFRTCRRLGIETVAVFSDADAQMPFVQEADEAFRLGPAPSAESYLRVDRILKAAAVTGADAIHPGYGFLAENAAFAEAVAGAGLIFVGPRPDAISAMGSKKEAKARVASAGVPVVPGYDGSDQDPAVLEAEAKRIGFPVLLKASAGGGGKGMKRVDKAEALSEAIASAKREALGAFGDDVLLIEKYIEKPRHIEVQIFGDETGKVVHLFERECSIQRRHQKIIEEAPSPALNDAQRQALGAAAVKVGEAISYTGAGTVEFIFDQNGEFYFLEVNTRLQVEHPVTEAITGLDLVEEQLRVAEGKALRFDTADLGIDGAAIEARLYAEDPAQGFLPQSGPLVEFAVPADGVGLRFDSGVETGVDVGIHYDPMLAKVVAHGRDRSEAILRLRRALRSMTVLGLPTNKAFLLRILDDEAFREGALHTHFIDERFGDSLAEAPRPERRWRAAWIAALLSHQERAEQLPISGIGTGFRNNAHTLQRARYVFGEAELELRYQRRWRSEALLFDVRRGDGSLALVRLVSEAPLEAPGGFGRCFVLELDDHRFEAKAVRVGEQFFVAVDGEEFSFAEMPRFVDPQSALPPGGYAAPMPGKVVKVSVKAGEQVDAGQTLIIMEAMKMEHAVTAHEAGTVTELRVAEGDQVEADALLVVIAGKD